MARGKKKESALTPEEKLERALVSESEQPYNVPKNWCFFYFTSLIDVEGGTQPPKSQFIDEPKDGYARLIQIRDFATDRYTVYVPDTPKMRHLEKKDILIARYGASLGRVCTGQKGVYNVALAKTIFSEVALNRKYVYWMLQSETFQFPLTQLSRTAQAGFNKDDLSGFAMPLAPFAEQQRIVDCIESLFAKLDEAKEKAQTVLDSFETRKAAILHKAFTGELTAKWRVEHGVSTDSWQSVMFDDCVAKMQNGLTKRTGSNGVPFAVLRLANLSDNGFITDDLREIVLDEKEQENYRLMPNDVLMIRVNGSKDNVGKQLLMGDQTDWAFCDHIIRIRYSDEILPAYMVMFSKSDTYRLYVKDNMVSSAGQNTISRKGMARLEVPIPCEVEQAEIVRILDSLFAKEQQAKEAAEAVLEKIDLLKKSILARAFRGELGTNDPSEESAVELLKGVL